MAKPSPQTEPNQTKPNQNPLPSLPGSLQPVHPTMWFNPCPALPSPHRPPPQYPTYLAATPPPQRPPHRPDPTNGRAHDQQRKKGMGGRGGGGTRNNPKATGPATASFPNQQAAGFTMPASPSLRTVVVDSGVGTQGIPHHRFRRKIVVKSSMMREGGMHHHVESVFFYS